MSELLFDAKVTPDWEALVDCIWRKGTPKRVHHLELFHDREIQDAICERYPVLEGLDPSDTFYEQRRLIAVQRFLGFDYVRSALDGLAMPLFRDNVEDTADLSRSGGRNYIDEHKGPIGTWADFEAYPWPEITDESTQSLEWYQENLPDDMCIITNGQFGHYCEYLSWLLGYETLCLKLYDDRELARAIAEKLVEMDKQILGRILQFDRVKAVFGSDDMGFVSSTLISPDDLREFVFPGHRLMAQMAHDKGLPYLLHSCGNLGQVMDDLIDDVKIDAKHSFEDTIESVIELKQNGYGQRIALLGGIDVDYLCRQSEAAIRQRVCDTLEVCQPGGGYCLGTGNSVTNYIPLDSYLAMVDEGNKFGR